MAIANGKYTNPLDKLLLKQIFVLGFYQKRLVLMQERNGLLVLLDQMEKYILIMEPKSS